MHPKLNYLVDLYDTRESTVSFVAMIRSMGQVQGGNKYRIYRSHVLSFLELMLTDPTMQELKLVLDNTKNQDLAKKYSLSIGGIYE